MNRAAPLTLSLALFLAPGLALGQGIIGGFDGEPETPAAPAQPTASTTSTSAPAVVFPALTDCQSQLSGLPYGDRDSTIALLDRRLVYWSEQSFTTIVPFRHPGQAEYTLHCFEKRLALLAAFVPSSEDRRLAQETADALRARWGNRLPELLTANSADAGTDAWWQDADVALGQLAALEIALENAAHNMPANRKRLLDGARTQIAEFAETIRSVKATQDVLDEDARTFWLRAMAWRARDAGLALDDLQRRDFQVDPDTAYALLTAQTTDGKPMPEAILAADLAPIVQQLRALRIARGTLDPGAPRDWSLLGKRQRVLEELYLVHYMMQTIETRIDDWQRDQAETYKLRLQLAHDVAVASGVSEAESRAARDAEWRAYREQQQKDRDTAIARWNAIFASERAGAVMQGPRLGGPDQ